MKKYLTIAKAEWLDAIQSYQEVILWILIDSIPIIVMASLWLSSGKILSPANISFLVTYYLLVFTISRLTGFYFELKMQDEIREGTFSRYLTKPVSIKSFLIWDNLGGKSFNTIFLLTPVVFVFTLMFYSYISFPRPQNLLLFLLDLIFVYFIQFSLSLIVASCSFFIEQAFAVNHLHWILDVVAGGYILPLTFYPEIIKNICDILPFAYIYYYPIQIFTDRYEFPDAWVKIGQTFLWAFILYLVSSFVLKTGIKKYSAVGG